MLVNNYIDAVSKFRNEIEIEYPGLKCVVTKYKIDPDNKTFKDSMMCYKYGFKFNFIQSRICRFNSISNLSTYPETLSDMEHRLEYNHINI